MKLTQYVARVRRHAAPLGLGLAGASAYAAPQTIDTADIVAQIGVGSAAVAAIGIAVLGVIAVAASFKIIRRAF